MRIRIVGAGVMGRGIAQWAATAGHTVELADARGEAVTEARDFVAGMLERAVRKGRTTEEEAQAALARLVPLADPLEGPQAGAEPPALVIEAVKEDPETKARLFTGLEKVLPAGTVFATNTSSLSVTGIGARLADPSRLAGLHFFNPVPLMKIAEVVPGAATRPDIPPLLTGFVTGCGHRAVTVADTPGFLVNHAGRGLVTEALALLEESVSDAAGIDRIARDVLGLRMGPFELMDLTGLDVTASVIGTVWRGFLHSDRLRPSYLTANRVTAGLHGRKTGRGFYAYEAERGEPAAEAPPEQPDDGGVPAGPVTVAGEGAGAEELRGALTRAGGSAGTADDGRAVVLVPTWGTTVAAAVAGRGLPPSRTLGVDPLSLEGRRRVLALTPATDRDAVRDATAVLARTGDGAPCRVTVVRDTPGSVAQRLLASVVGVAASIAERAIAAPADIDLAVTLGLGYPNGPLTWGDRIGADRMLALHRALYESTGDPRYRPTRWVTERAQLGLPLTTPDAPLP